MDVIIAPVGSRIWRKMSDNFSRFVSNFRMNNSRQGGTHHCKNRKRIRHLICYYLRSIYFYQSSRRFQTNSHRFNLWEVPRNFRKCGGRRQAAEDPKVLSVVPLDTKSSSVLQKLASSTEVPNVCREVSSCPLSVNRLRTSASTNGWKWKSCDKMCELVIFCLDHLHFAVKIVMDLINM